MKYLPETLTALSATVGYALVVWAVGSLLTPWIWVLGAGVYLLGLAGFRLLGVIAYVGLYALMQDGEE